MIHRAYMHQYGRGGPKNEAEAIRLYEQSIALGNAGAQFLLKALLNKQKIANKHDDTVRLFRQALSKLKTKAELLKNVCMKFVTIRYLHQKNKR